MWLGMGSGMGFETWHGVQRDTGLGQCLGLTCFGNRVWDGVYDAGWEPGGHRVATRLQNKIGDRLDSILHSATNISCFTFTLAFAFRIDPKESMDGFHSTAPDGRGGH